MAWAVVCAPDRFPGWSQGVGPELNRYAPFEGLLLCPLHLTNFFHEMLSVDPDAWSPDPKRVVFDKETIFNYNC